MLNVQTTCEILPLGELVAFRGREIKQEQKVQFGTTVLAYSTMKIEISRTYTWLKRSFQQRFKGGLFVLTPFGWRDKSSVAFTVSQYENTTQFSDVSILCLNQVL